MNDISCSSLTRSSFFFKRQIFRQERKLSHCEYCILHIFESEISQVMWNILFWKYQYCEEILFGEGPWERIEYIADYRVLYLYLPVFALIVLPRNSSSAVYNEEKSVLRYCKNYFHNTSNPCLMNVSWIFARKEKTSKKKKEKEMKLMHRKLILSRVKNETL